MPHGVIEKSQWTTVHVASGIAFTSRSDLPHCLLEILPLSLQLRSKVVQEIFHFSWRIFHRQERIPEDIQKGENSESEADKPNNDRCS